MALDNHAFVAGNEIDSFEDYGDVEKVITVGICAMEKKVVSKPMEEILSRIDNFKYLRIIIFPESVILNLPVHLWPKCDCLISFHSAGFPLHKADEYVKLYRPLLINDVAMQFDLQNRCRTYEILEEAGIPHPRYVCVHEGEEVLDTDDQIEVNGQIFAKPFVEKPLSAEDHNIYIYFQSGVGGGSQRLFRKIGCRSSVYSSVNGIRREGSYIYEEFMPTDGTDVKVYTVGPEYAHAEARKSPALDGKVERDEFGKEVRYPVILRAEEKMIARKICLAFKQTVCGFDLLRANGKSYVCDVNGFSFVKNSVKYYDDCALILGNKIMRELAPQFFIPYTVQFQPEDVPFVATTFGTVMELRCVIAVIRHGDRTPKQKMKIEVTHPYFMEFFEKYGGNVKRELKFKKPRHLQEILDIVRKLLDMFDKESELYDPNNLPSEKQAKLAQIKAVLEMHGHFSGINRKVQLKKVCHKTEDNKEPHDAVLLILKWGGELTEEGRSKAVQLGKTFRRMYPGGQGAYANRPDTGFLRLHSTYRHDLKIYASDEGRVQMTAAAFAKGLLALEGELAPILVQMVKSANTNGLLDDDVVVSRLSSEVKHKLASYLSCDNVLTEEQIKQIVPTQYQILIDRLGEIGNPMEMCRQVHLYISEMTNLIRMKMMDPINYKKVLYHCESWELMLRRWSKLEKDFYDKVNGTFDFSKIPVIYDCIKYDISHNQHNLKFKNSVKLYVAAKLLSEVVVPQEYGLTKEEKLSVARGIITPLLTKIRTDLQRNVNYPTEDDNEEDEHSNRLDPRRLTEEERSIMGIQTPNRHVRTRLYFTSESHVHSLVNVLKYGDLFTTENAQWKEALSYLNNISELGYLTQIVIMLYEDPSVPADSENRFHVELHFSPGSNEAVLESNGAENNEPDENYLSCSGVHATPYFLRTSSYKRFDSTIGDPQNKMKILERKFRRHSKDSATLIEYDELESIRFRRDYGLKDSVYNTFHGTYSAGGSHPRLSTIFDPKIIHQVAFIEENREKVFASTDDASACELPINKQYSLKTLHNNLSFATLDDFLRRIIGSKQNCFSL